MRFCVVLCIVCFVTYSVLFVCICVLNYCHWVATQLQLNISYHIISYHIKKGRGRTSTTILKGSRQKHRSWQLNSNVKNALQQFQMKTCQSIKRLKDKKINPGYESLKIRPNWTAYKLHDIRPLTLAPFWITISTSKLITYLLTPWSRVLLEKLTSKLCS